MKLSALSDLAIDFDSIESEIRTNLQSRQTFRAAFPGEAGEAVVELISGISAMMLYRQDAAVLNGFMPTAFSKTGIFAEASSLGAPAGRKIGANQTITITPVTVLSSPVTIPAYSSWSKAGLTWYNSSDIVLGPGQAPVTTLLNQGIINYKTLICNGTPNQRYILGSNFTIDENSINLTVNSVQWTKDKSSLISYSALGTTMLAYLERTQPDGPVAITFGNGTYGKIPSSSDSVIVRYAECVGLASNSTIVGDAVTLLTNISVGPTTLLVVTAITASQASTGQDEDSPSTVKYTSPRLFAANKRNVRRDDYVSYLIKYGGFTSAIYYGEYEQSLALGYADNTMMNRAYFSGLLNTTALTTVNAGTGVGASATNFTIPPAQLPIVPGSIALTYGTFLFQDRGGNGILVSPSVSYNIITSSLPTLGSSGTSASAFDQNTATTWAAGVLPTSTAPVRIAVDLGSGYTHLATSFRFLIVNDGNVNTRSSPKTFSVLGSNVASPTMTSDTNFTVIAPSITIGDVYTGQWTPWYTINQTNLAAYRWICFKFTDSYGASDCKVVDVQVQNEQSISTVNYATGVGTVNIPSSYPTTGTTMSAQVMSPDLTSAQITALYTYFGGLCGPSGSVVKYTDGPGAPQVIKLYVPPVVEQFNVSVVVYYKPSYAPATVQVGVQSAINDLFTLSESSFGQVIAISDISSACLSVEGVDYVDVQSPMADRSLNYNNVAVLYSTTITMSRSTRVFQSA